MKNLFLTTVAFVATLAVCGAENPPALVPVPQHLTFESGRTVDLAAARICIPGQEKELIAAATLFSRDLARECGLSLKVDRKAGGDIRLMLDTSLGEEAYRLSVRPEGVVVEGGSPAGVFYGLQSLRQLVAQYGTTLPEVQVEDAPSFGYRGAMLDCCRHFFTVEEVKTFLDILALHKINRFHWHLTEDQGWRIEIKRYPEPAIIRRTTSARWWPMRPNVSSR